MSVHFNGFTNRLICKIFKSLDLKLLSAPMKKMKIIPIYKMLRITINNGYFKNENIIPTLYVLMICVLFPLSCKDTLLFFLLQSQNYSSPIFFFLIYTTT